ncbi:MAG: hypothetical protein WCC60_21055, partial [Ilumatobacteraceae bacterium]
YITYMSGATNLVTGDTNAVDDIFLYDRITAATTRVNVATGGAQVVGDHSTAPSVSNDGRYITFQTGAANLVPGDANGTNDIFLHDLVTGTTTRINLAPNGTEAVGGGSYSSAISADGRYITYESGATNLVTADTNNSVDVFLIDRSTGITSRVSVTSGGGQVGGASYRPRISADGRCISFASQSGDLVSGDTNTSTDVFVRDQGTS